MSRVRNSRTAWGTNDPTARMLATMTAMSAGVMSEHRTSRGRAGRNHVRAATVNQPGAQPIDPTVVTGTRRPTSRRLGDGPSGERCLAGGEDDRVVLWRVDAAAQNVAIMAFDRVMA